MPNIKSAKKRVLVNETRRQQNRTVISEVKTAIKKFNAAIDSNNIAEAERLLPVTASVIDSACSKGTLHKNNAAHKKSAIAQRLDSVKSGKVTIEIKKDNKAIAAQKALAAKEAREASKAEIQRKAAEKAAAKEAEDAEKSKAKGKTEKTSKTAKETKAEPKKDTKPKAKKDAAKDEPKAKEAKPKLKEPKIK